MKSGPKKFYKRDADFQEFHRRIKFAGCPNCQKTGCLILHGYLYGYDEKSHHQKIIRGHRIFCSNRNLKRGCGRTFSILAAHVLRNFTITTQSLWNFLNNLLQGMTKLAAFGLTDLPFSPSSVYRLYQRIYLRQHRLRTLLLKRIPPPECVQSRNPLIKTILHLQSAFKRDSDPLSAFQLHFQTSLL